MVCGRAWQWASGKSGAEFLCIGNAAMRFGGAVGAALPVKPERGQLPNDGTGGGRDLGDQGCVRASSNVRVASEMTLRSQRTSSE
ncbi:Uncharacterised protein [Pandoraea pulmonicola]|uniref:Uncharacterized protein n=1 Tax=Pandoraea pulmonicola TaxID=93221 RepID=A0AAJ5CYN0_PANPU|nr:Uncharacterised protein [Pandoraea pulmonicola]